ncbi:hypothetical protein AAG906_013186 [Vitis piasezkii]
MPFTLHSQTEVAPPPITVPTPTSEDPHARMDRLEQRLRHDNGIGCPRIHLRLYSTIMRAHGLDEAQMIMLFPMSLSGAQRWFASLDVSRRRTWDDLAQEFLRQDAFNTISRPPRRHQPVPRFPETHHSYSPQQHAFDPSSSKLIGGVVDCSHSQAATSADSTPIDDHVHMLSGDDSNLEPIMPDVIYEMRSRVMQQPPPAAARPIEGTSAPKESTQARISIWSLLASSSTHRDALIRALSQIRVETTTSPKGLIHMMTAGKATCIVFSDDDLPPRARITHVYSIYLLVVQQPSPICPFG